MAPPRAQPGPLFPPKVAIATQFNRKLIEHNGGKVNGLFTTPSRGSRGRRLPVAGALW